MKQTALYEADVILRATVKKFWGKDPVVKTNEAQPATIRRQVLLRAIFSTKFISCYHQWWHSCIFLEIIISRNKYPIKSKILVGIKVLQCLFFKIFYLFLCFILIFQCTVVNGPDTPIIDLYTLTNPKYRTIPNIKKYIKYNK